MSLRTLPSLLLSSLVSFSLAASLASIGCAAPTDSEEPSEDQVAETQDELTAAASQLVGSYWTSSAVTGGFARLQLKTNGTYTASVDGAGQIVCVMSPCLLAESGTWNASAKASGGFRLRVRPTGARSRWYTATKSGGATATLALTRAGVTQTLNKLAANTCLDDTDCASSEECGPKFCFMYCEVNDPSCCGPSACQPKAPPPPPDPCAAVRANPNICLAAVIDPLLETCCVPPPVPACWGAWLDELGGCRAPNDGGYPASCCAGLSTPCGPSNCGVGKVCCNPLAGICTDPGQDCAQ